MSSPRFTDQVTFDEMPGTARVWAFGASEPLAGPAAERLLESVDRFLQRWHAHGHPVVGARDWRYDRFLLIAADEEATGVSGCSIDSLFRTLQGLESDLGTSLIDRSRVWYRDPSGEVRSATRPEFRARVRDGSVGPDTTVFDQTVSSVADVRDGRWERRLAESWHAGAFLR